MKFRISALAAVLSVCAGCVEINYNLGAGFLPAEQSYTTEVLTIDLNEIEMAMVDSLSGFSDDHLTVGAIMDEEGNVTTRSAAITLVPIFKDSLDFGIDPKFKRFHLSLASDSLSVTDKVDAHILQMVNVHELSEPINPEKQFDCNITVPFNPAIISRGRPVANGKDSLSFDFTEEYAQKFFDLTKEDLSKWDKYIEKIPGLYFDTDQPAGFGGRFSNFEIQLGFNTDQGLISGNFAELAFSSEYKGVRRDTAFYFYLGAQKFNNLDSLISSGSKQGSMPQHALNLTGEEAFRHHEGVAGDKILISGGGGLKPLIRAKYIRSKVKEALSAKGYDIEDILVNKATIKLCYEFPEDLDRMFLFPDVLSPTTRIRTDTTASFVSLSDASSKTENQGNIDRVHKWFCPDFSYHMQEILTIDESKLNADYDIWMMLMTYTTVTTDTSNDEMAELYQQLAYQSYYNQMYGGGGYSSLSSYSNYYSYMMMAQYAATSTSTSQTLEMDNTKYFKCWFHGPAAAAPEKRPKLILTYSVPNAKKQ